MKIKFDTIENKLIITATENDKTMNCEVDVDLEKINAKQFIEEILKPRLTLLLKSFGGN